MRNSETAQSKIKVSVIISTYNRAEQLKKAVFSVQKQTVDNIEILVCDDGSTDATRIVVEEIAKNDSRVIYINCGHGGRPAVPRNIGIRQAKGEWLAFLDDDDVWNPVKLEAQLHELNKHNAKACCTNAFIYEAGNNTGKRYFEGLVDTEYSFRNIIRVNPVIHSSMMIHSSLIAECKGFPEDENHRAIEDYGLWYRVAGYTKIVYMNQPLIGYLMTSSSSIRKQKVLTFDEQKAIIEKGFSEWLKDKKISIRIYYLCELCLCKFDCVLQNLKDKLWKLIKWSL